jgi:hypothetical protein
MQSMDDLKIIGEATKRASEDSTARAYRQATKLAMYIQAQGWDPGESTAAMAVLLGTIIGGLQPTKSERRNAVIALTDIIYAAME